MIYVYNKEITLESAYEELETSLQEATDFIYTYDRFITEAEGPGFLTRIKNLWDSIIEAFRNFFRSAKKKIDSSNAPELTKKKAKKVFNKLKDNVEEANKARTKINSDNGKRELDKFQKVVDGAKKEGRNALTALYGAAGIAVIGAVKSKISKETTKGVDKASESIKKGLKRLVKKQEPEEQKRKLGTVQRHGPDMTNGIAYHSYKKPDGLLIPGTKAYKDYMKKKNKSEKSRAKAIARRQGNQTPEEPEVGKGMKDLIDANAAYEKGKDNQFYI